MCIDDIHTRDQHVTAADTRIERLCEPPRSQGPVQLGVTGQAFYIELERTLTFTGDRTGLQVAAQSQETVACLDG